MFNLLRKLHFPEAILSSRLYDETSFYPAFIHDLKRCKKEVIIESPFITHTRVQFLRPIFEDLISRGVKVYIITRHPEEHEECLAVQAAGEIAELEMIGVHVLLWKGNHHRKLAVIDRQILWEGSLNILSHTNSCEIMRRIPDKKAAIEMFEFLKLKKFLSK